MRRHVKANLLPSFNENVLFLIYKYEIGEKLHLCGLEQSGESAVLQGAWVKRDPILILLLHALGDFGADQTSFNI